MSFLSEYVLSQGTWAGAGRASAMQLSALAKAGYVRYSLQGNRAVRIVRTAKRDTNLSREEQFLLRAVFGSANTVLLKRPHQRPVAQSAITVTRARLVKEGFIRSLSPRTLQRRLYWAYLFFAVAITAVAAAATTPLAIIFVPCVALLVWVPYNVSIRRLLRSRQVFYKRKGARVKRRNARRAVQQGVTPEVNIMAAALSQRYVPSKGYPRANELWYEGLRSGSEHATDFGGTIRENAASYDGFADGNGDGGGDGGGDGDGGGGDG